MKKFIRACITCIIAGIALVGCSKDDDFVSTYSERQEKAFALFNGTWADIQFSNLSGGELGSLLPDPDLIVGKSSVSCPLKPSDSAPLC